MLAYLPQFGSEPPSYFCGQVRTSISLRPAALLTVVQFFTPADRVIQCGIGK